jgi:predicted DNA-binding transcriptional regulator AlpA
MIDREYLSTNEVSEKIGRTPGAVRNLVYRKRIPYRKPAGKLVFLRKEIEQWIENTNGLNGGDIMRFGEVYKKNKERKYAVLDRLQVGDCIDCFFDENESAIQFEKIRSGAYRHGLITNKRFKCHLDRENRKVEIYRIG